MSEVFCRNEQERQDNMFSPLIITVVRGLQDLSSKKEEI